MGQKIGAQQAKEWLKQGREALRRAISVAGGQDKVAAALEVPQSTVSYWLNGSKFGVAAEKCPLIESLYGIPREELRPDIYLAFRSPKSSQPTRASV